tara:strand:- start:69037 stop:69510 length:474 start_codon:yes stop_codon:yes gene_type:complete
MSYNKIINQYFSDNFNEDAVCLFKQGYVTETVDFGLSCINMLSDEIVDQPSSAFFIRIGMFGGAVNNASIGTTANVRKRQPIALRFNLYTPAGQSNGKEIDMEKILDDLFLPINIKSADSYVYADTAIPKTVAKIDSTGSAVWNDKAITYRLIYEYY